MTIMGSIEEATLAGLAVRTCLARPPLEALLPAVAGDHVVAERLKLTLEHLTAIGTLSEAERDSLLAYVTTGALPSVPAGPSLLTVGTVLISTVLSLHDADAESLFGGPLSALGHVMDAAAAGAVLGGGLGALACAAIAAMQVTQGIKSLGAEISIDAVRGIKSGIKSGLGIKS
jgi:hypothetical protein